MSKDHTKRVFSFSKTTLKIQSLDLPQFDKQTSHYANLSDLPYYKTAKPLHTCCKSPTYLVQTNILLASPTHHNSDGEKLVAMATGLKFNVCETNESAC